MTDKFGNVFVKDSHYKETSQFIQNINANKIKSNTINTETFIVNQGILADNLTLSGGLLANHGEFKTVLKTDTLDAKNIVSISGDIVIDPCDNLVITSDTYFNCNNINDLKGINFCDGTYIGEGNSFDISTDEILHIKSNRNVIIDSNLTTIKNKVIGVLDIEKVNDMSNIGLYWRLSETGNTVRSWSGITWSEELEIFLANGGTNLGISKDGFDWKVIQLSNISLTRSVWSKELGIFCGVDSNSNIAISSNGFDWTLIDISGMISNNLNLTDIVWSPDVSYNLNSIQGNGLFCAVASSGGINSNDRIVVSPNGIEWYPATNVPFINTWRGITWASNFDASGGMFCAVSDTTTGPTTNERIAISRDGLIWESAISGLPANNYRGIAWSETQQRFSTCGFTSSGSSNRGRSYWSTDGKNWTVASSINTGPNFLYMIWVRELDQFVIIGNRATNLNMLRFSNNGEVWLSGSEYGVKTIQSTIITSPLNRTMWNTITWSPKLLKFSATCLIEGDVLPSNYSIQTSIGIGEKLYTKVDSILTDKNHMHLTIENNQLNYQIPLIRNNQINLPNINIEGNVELSGNLTMRCNDISGVNGITFCDGTYIGQGGSFDISANQELHISSTENITIDPSNSLNLRGQLAITSLGSIYLPQAPLDIFEFENQVYFKGGAGARARQLTFRTEGSGSNAGVAHFINAPSVNGVIGFETASVERLRIQANGNIGTSNGNLGVNTLNPTTNLDVSGNVLIRNNLTVNNNVDISGNLIVRGSTTNVSTQDLVVKDNLIVINQTMDTCGNPINAVLPNPTNFESGFVVYRGPDISGNPVRNPYQFLFNESSKTFRVGISGEMQPVATREDNPTNNGVAIWDASDTRFVTDRGFLVDTSGNVDISGNLSMNDNIINDVSSIIFSKDIKLTQTLDNSLNPIKIGYNAGNINQNQLAIAIGTNAGQNSQSSNSIAIGSNAGRDNQHNNTIILNASNSVLNSDISNAFYVDPIRNDEGSALLQYNTTNKEITYSNTIIGNLDISGNLNVSGELVVDNNVTFNSNLSMNDNLINDVSGINFSDGTYIGIGNSFDINANQELHISSTQNIIIVPSNSLIINGNLGIPTNIQSTIDIYKTQTIPSPFEVSFNTLQVQNNMELKSNNPTLFLYDTQNKNWTIGETTSGIRYISNDATAPGSGYEKANILVKVEDTFGQNVGLSFGTKRFDRAFTTQNMYLNRQGVLIVGRDGDIDPIYNSSESQGPLLMVSGPNKGIIELTSSQTGNLNNGIIGEIDFVNRGSNSNFKRKSAIISQLSGTNGSSTIGSNMSFFTAPDGIDSNGIERMRITNNGNVGIGITNPNSTLDVSGNVNINGNLSMNDNLINDVSGINFSDGTYIGIGNSFDISSTQIIKINNDKIVVDTSGNIGIGTIIPANKLDIIGGMNISGRINLRDQDTSNYYSALYNNVGNTILRSAPSTDTIVIRNQDLSKLYASFDPSGTTIGLRLNVIGNAKFDTDVEISGSTLLQSNLVVNGNANFNSDVEVSGSTLLQSNLVVNGNIDFSGNLSMNDNLINDVSGIYFSNNTFIGVGNSFDISSEEIIKFNNDNLVIDTSGRIGIGKTNPSNTLDVYHSIGNSGVPLKIEAENGSGADLIASLIGHNAGYIDIARNNQTSKLRMGVNSSNSAFIESYVSNLNINTPVGNAMIIGGANNNVGIGTTNPLEKLHVNGFGIIENTSTANSTVLTVRGRANGGSYPSIIKIDQGNGATSPNQGVQLEFVGRDASANTYQGASIRALHTDVDSLTAATEIGLMTSNNKIMTEKVRIDKNGNVGIGTTIPISKLDVKGTITVDNEIHLRSSNVRVIGDSSNNMRLFSGGSEKVRLLDNGNVGIGKTSPNATLDVNGNTIVNGTLIVNTGTNSVVYNPNTGFTEPVYVNDNFHTIFNGKISGSNGGTGQIVIGGNVIANSSGSNFNTCIGYGNEINTSVNSLALGRNCDISGGFNSVAIGSNINNSHTDTIILNGSGSNLSSDVSNAFYVSPIRNNTGSSLLQYDTLRKEITHSNTLVGDIDISGNLSMNDNLINDVSGINFSDGTYIGHGDSFDISTNEVLHLKSSQNVLVDGNAIFNNDISVNGTIYHSGNFIPPIGGNDGLAEVLLNGNEASTNIDMSDNSIVDVSGIFFSDGTYLGQGNSFDISTNEELHLTSTKNIILDTTNNLLINGNVGIGITNPISKLHLNGEIIENNVYLKNRYKKLKNNVTASNAVSTWTARAAPNTNTWKSVCWSPELGLFCAVADSGGTFLDRVMTSPDGIIWTARVAPSAYSNTWKSVCWSPELGLFCAVASSFGENVIMTSPDGITWTARAAPLNTNNEWSSICWSPELGLFCAVAFTGGTAANRVMTSPNGITWTARAAPNTNTWESVCWSSELGLFCAVASMGGSAANRVMTSPDGITWTARAAPNINYWISVCWSSELGLFCAVSLLDGTAANCIMTSPNGITWTARAAPNRSGWTSVCWSPELGLFCAVASSASLAPNRIMVSPNGIAWTAREAPNTNTWKSVCWSPELGLFCAIAESGGTASDRVMTSTFTVPFRSDGNNIISNNTSTVTIRGALAKGSGSFKIDHPLKPETHHLVHSFIEGPQADLIYRGKVKLIEGKAVINIDKEAGMTEGTFNALCRNVQCFTSNETDWSQVYGYVNDNILTILCQDVYSSATISWMVIGERKDRHMIETDWTDDNGKVIVEPSK